jgi:hypothetical protein
VKEIVLMTWENRVFISYLLEGKSLLSVQSLAGI